ncbi:protein kinase-like protein [Xylariomycetidae sp. FL0641]|nr:protein kinase-like protein [Xylariomycetidae sp. FL0641]
MRRIAQIFCRVEETKLPIFKPPGDGFLSDIDGGDRFEPRSSLDFDLLRGQDVRVGRTLDSNCNDIVIRHPYISRTHFMIYSITYGADGDEHLPPLIYVQDCESLEGTKVNGQDIGSRRQGAHTGYLLSSGDVISIWPHWKFHVHLPDSHYEADPLLDSRRPDQESKVISKRYEIKDRVLGTGAFSSVHLAIEKGTGKQLACKIHDLDKLRRINGWQNTIRRVMDETDLLGKFNHRHLLSLERAYKSTHTLYTFTDLATGGDLHSVAVRSEGGLEEHHIRLIVHQILSAVRYLHKSNIAHRDLKPENIFFAAGPFGKGRLIVGDLGFAAPTTGGRLASTVGTPGGWMAPEIYRGSEYSMAVDMWSIGMITLFLFDPGCEDLADLRGSNQEVIDRTVTDIFEDLSAHGRDCSEYAQSFIRSCLTKDPSRRATSFQSRRHPWLRQHSSDVIDQLREMTRTWRPSNRISPPITDLDLINSLQSNSSNEGSLRDLGESVVIPNSQPPQWSPFFPSPRVNAEPRIRITEPSQ